MSISVAVDVSVDSALVQVYGLEGESPLGCRCDPNMGLVSSMCEKLKLIVNFSDKNKTNIYKSAPYCTSKLHLF